MFKNIISFELLDFRQYLSLILSERFAVCNELLNHNMYYVELYKL